MDDTPIRLLRFESAARHDPAIDRGLLEGTGKRLRHVKLRPGQEPDGVSLAALIEKGYRDMQDRLSAGAR